MTYRAVKFLVCMTLVVSTKRVQYDMAFKVHCITVIYSDPAPCLSNEFDCPFGTFGASPCISEPRTCNGYPDCINGTDEQDCPGKFLIINYTDFMYHSQENLEVCY